jgi:hypothetical protein
MDIEKEIQKITLNIQIGKEDFVSGTKRILTLLKTGKCLCCQKIKLLTHCEDCGNDIGIVDN